MSNAPPRPKDVLPTDRQGSPGGKRTDDHPAQSLERGFPTLSGRDATQLQPPSLIRIMLRKIAIGLAAAAIAISSSTADAAARHGSGVAKPKTPRHLQSAASPHRRTVPKSHGAVTPYVVTDRNWLSASGFKYNRPYGYWPPPQTEPQPLGMERAH
jgi:hypothetical protein